MIETYPIADGLVRSVSIRTAKGIYERPITKVCVLEGSTSEQSANESVTNGVTEV